MSQLTKNRLEEMADLIANDPTPQTFGTFTDVSSYGKIKYCASAGLCKKLGAGDLRLFASNMWPNLTFNYIQKKLGITKEERREKYLCPKCGKVRYLLKLIPHLNDVHAMKKLEIAKVLPLAVKTDKPVDQMSFKEFFVIIKNAYLK